MSKQLIIVITIISLAVVGISFAGGIIYQSQKDSQIITSAALAQTLGKNLNAKNISISARGNVRAMVGRVVSISEKGNSLDIPIAKDAIIYDLTAGASGVVKKANISIITPGKYVTIAISIDSKGNMVGGNVFVSPQAK